MNEDESETHNFGLMSFSSLVHDMCLGRDRQHFYHNYHSDAYGHCDQEHIVNEFIPFLDRGMKVRSHLLLHQSWCCLKVPCTFQRLRNTPLGMGTLDPKLQFPLGCSCRNCLIKSESKMAAVGHDGSRGLYSSVTIWSILMCDICIRPIFGSRNSNMTSFLSYQGSQGSKSKIALVGDGE